MGQRVTIDVPLNRVEGDLEVEVELEDDVVRVARCSGVMFRGFEQILVGRGPLDGLVITPRICGICSIAHLAAAVAALDRSAGLQPPPAAQRVRSVALMTENLQSDARHAALMFNVDFLAARHRDHALYEEAQRRYAPLAGEVAVEVLRETRELVRVIGILGGQWPHKAFMVPGGVASAPGDDDFRQCAYHATRYRNWFEQRVLGCRIERWLAVRSAAELESWLDEAPSHQQGEVGFLLRFLRGARLEAVGRWPAVFLSYGSLPFPADDGAGQGLLVPAGCVTAPRFGVPPAPVTAFDQAAVREHVACSWFGGADSSPDDVVGDSGQHPFDGQTAPYATGRQGSRYSWAKAPRYAGSPAETGPLAERLVAADPLFVDLVAREGSTVCTRQLARLTRGAHLLPAMQRWLDELVGQTHFYEPPGEIAEGEGCGLVQAARGALGHWVKLREGKIASYQIIAPTTWNASPRDAVGVPGPLESALEGVRVSAVDDPIELGHVVRSFDPCLVCSVHTLRPRR